MIIVMNKPITSKDSQAIFVKAAMKVKKNAPRYVNIDTNTKFRELEYIVHKT